MQYPVIGEIRKLKSRLASPIDYSLPISEVDVPLNPLLGKTIHLEFLGEIRCQGCHKISKKSYNQGYCFICSQKLACCDLCILKPERCHFSQGTCREPEWATMNCMIPHIVYLANTSGLKVGITRETQIPTRWIDQGAIEALPLIRVSTRYVSGLVEVLLAKHIADKTDWRKMLKGISEPLDIVSKKKELLSMVGSQIEEIVKSLKDSKIEFLDSDSTITQIEYPVLEYPTKIASLSFEKTPVITAKLLGIKGQYLILDTGVLNIRNASGYRVSVTVQ